MMVVWPRSKERREGNAAGRTGWGQVCKAVLFLEATRTQGTLERTQGTLERRLTPYSDSVSACLKGCTASRFLGGFWSPPHFQFNYCNCKSNNNIIWLVTSDFMHDLSFQLSIKYESSQIQLFNLILFSIK